MKIVVVEVDCGCEEVRDEAEGGSSDCKSLGVDRLGRV